MQSKFQTLDTFLYQHQVYWRSEPFHLCQQDELPWRRYNEALFAWLQSLDEQQIQVYKDQPDSLAEELGAFFPDLNDIVDVIQIPTLNREGLDLPKGTDTGIPGRKLEQIMSMSEAVLGHHKGSEWLEWCSGKGFLGRILSQQSKQPVTSFEWQQSLCDSGQAIADAQQLPMQFVQGDAFSEDANKVFNHNQHAVALHACGDLHVTLLNKVVNYSLPAVTISPCCYHLIQSERYQAMSTVAQSAQLSLSKSDLRIPLQETVTGGERVKRHRQLEMSFRLGFSQLLKRELGVLEYLPVPSIKKSELAEGFEAFCWWAANQKEIALPSGLDFDFYERLGEQLFWNMERLSLVQQVFRRPLEMWLTLDRALYLEEQGYQTSVEQFCERHITPRNILIRGWKVDK
jgi:hypothetical protein